GLIDLGELFRRAEGRAGSRRAVVLRTAGPPRLIAAVLLGRPHPAALLLWDLDASAALARVAARIVDLGRATARSPQAERGEETAGASFGSRTLDDPPPQTLPRPDGVDWVWGPGPASRRLERAAARGLAEAQPLFIYGAPGTGKKHLARCLHAVAGRPGPMVIAGCADLSDAALAQGFRVAVEEKGTLLLEGLEDLKPELYEAVLQLAGAVATRAGLIVTAGSGEPDLPDALTDILCRCPLGLEPLDRRRDEIPRLVRHFLARSGDDGPGLTVETVRQLMLRSWPGHVAELRSTVEALVEAASEGRAIESSMLTGALEAAGVVTAITGSSGPETGDWAHTSPDGDEP
ncbi:MAG: hypothetical protein AAFX50_06000, partial [Acidobacteriota bacterium]